MKLSDFTFNGNTGTAPKAAVASAPRDLRTVTDLLDAALSRYNVRPAVCDAERTLSYAELDRFSARLARFLQTLGVGPERFVGIMLDREIHFAAAVCGVLRAGGAYVPIDPALPLSRRRDMLRDCGAVALLSQTAFLGDMNTLQWECPDLANIICLDAEDFAAVSESPGELMSTDLWDLVAADGTDDIQAGGWKSPYTGQWLSREIMDGYAENVRAKLAPLLKPDARVLEIGCASGITMARVAPLCGNYLGLDLSDRVLARAGETARRFGLTNVSLRRLRADEIDLLPERSFDAVIVNSVIESFPGLNYLRRFLDLALTRLSAEGFLFLGNVWDLNRRDALVASLEDFARENAGRGYTTKLDMSGELFVAKAFFADWAAQSVRRGRPLTLSFSAMQADERELAGYGYDLLIEPGDAAHLSDAPLKGTFALGDFSGLPETPPETNLKPEHPVYAIFTSGTTGRPKGAVIEHRNLVNLIGALTETVLSAPVGPDGRGNAVDSRDRRDPFYPPERIGRGETMRTSNTNTPLAPLKGGIDLDKSTAMSGAFTTNQEQNQERPAGLAPVIPAQAGIQENYRTAKQTPGQTASGSTGEDHPGPLQLGQIASFSFDASVQLLFAGLAGGHTVHLTSNAARRDPARLHEFLEERKVDVLDITPSLLAVLLDHWESSATASRVRALLVGGEVLRPELLRRFYGFPAHARARVINAYGPTECCVDATLQVLTSRNWSERPVIPIGTPIRGMEVFILDRHGHVLPPGVPGEILLAGSGVGRGYCNAPLLTAERFVSHPTDPDRRAYRTGDLGRWRSDGVLEYMHRNDSQVKVRGYRIECGEIETALLACPGVRQAALTAGDFLGDGTAALAAYVVADEAVATAAMREHLLRKLPEYMVPSHFVRLDRLPMNVNGKVDRRALPPPVSAGSEACQVRPPETATEKRLAVIWVELLRLTEVDVEADFFTQGGHSILAVRLVSLVEKAFGARLPLDRLFAGATVRDVAAAIDEILSAGSRPAWSPVVAARAEGNLPPLVCFHPVGGNILCYQQLAAALGPDQPVYMIQSRGLEPGQVPFDSVEEMTAFYLDAVTRVLPEGPYALAGWSFGGLVAYEAAHQLMGRGEVVSAVALLDSVAVPDRVAELLSGDEPEYLATMFGEVMPLEADLLRAMDHEERIVHIMTEGRNRGVFPPDIDREQMGRLLNLFQKNGLAAVRYRAPTLPLKVLLVRPEEITAAALNLTDDPLQGWGTRALDGVTLCRVPGNHGSMLAQPHVAAVAAAMAPYLQRQAASIAAARCSHG